MIRLLGHSTEIPAMADESQLEVHSLRTDYSHKGLFLVVEGRVVDDNLWDLLKGGQPVGFSVSNRGEIAVVTPPAWWRRCLRWVGGLFVRFGEWLESL